MDMPIHYQTIFRQPNENFHLLFSSLCIVADSSITDYSVVALGLKVSMFQKTYETMKSTCNYTLLFTSLDKYDC